MTGPMGSGLPQLGLPRRLAIVGFALPLNRRVLTNYDLHLWIPRLSLWFQYLMEKTDLTQLPWRSKLIEKPFIISDFLALCNAFPARLPLFIRILPGFFGSFAL
jgi:hypothetical protein